MRNLLVLGLILAQAQDSLELVFKHQGTVICVPVPEHVQTVTLDKDTSLQFDWEDKSEVWSFDGKTWKRYVWDKRETKPLLGSSQDWKQGEVR